MDARREVRGRRALAALAFCAASLAGRGAGEELPAARDLRALSRQLRVDLVWREDASRSYEIERAKDPGDPFAKIHPAEIRSVVKRLERPRPGARHGAGAYQRLLRMLGSVSRC